ncbi:MAG: YqgE/AlgH family protein [Candidatus Midichloria sp.]|nr:YqgE/AlgH family protein [Candidatus Midichloria sp.]
MLNGDFMKLETAFQSLEGKILVASPYINDQNFEQSLVYICMHDENGAVGVIINQRIGRIAEVDLNNYIKDFQNLVVKKNRLTSQQMERLYSPSKRRNYPVLFGGPVYSDKIVVLSLTKEQEKSFAENQHLTLYTDMVTFLKEYISGKSHSKLLFAKGIAAWNPSQLEEEVSENNWFVVPASIDLLFSQRSKSKWEDLIKKFGIEKYHNLVGYSGTA